MFWFISQSLPVVERRVTNRSQFPNLPSADDSLTRGVEVSLVIDCKHKRGITMSRHVVIKPLLGNLLPEKLEVQNKKM